MSENHTAHKKPFEPTRDNYNDTYVERLLFDNPLVRLGAVTLSVISGLFAAKRTTEREYYKENKEKGPYAKPYSDRQNRINANQNARDAEKITLEQYNEERKNIEKDWRAIIKGIDKTRGIPTEGLSGFFIAPIKKAATLSRGDAQRIGINMLGTFGVTIGAYMAVRQMSHYRHMLTQIDDKIDRLTYDLDNKPDRPSGAERIEDIEAHQAANMRDLEKRLADQEATHAATATRA